MWTTPREDYFGFCALEMNYIELCINVKPKPNLIQTKEKKTEDKFYFNRIQNSKQVFHSIFSLRFKFLIRCVDSRQTFHRVRSVK